ncbi:MAG: hypothetical protein HY508_01550 [Acidobacteria bacterium]|nr:hypothetical protein [Acidobacteriota bacterium]
MLCDISTRDIEAYQGKRRREGVEGRTVNIEVGVLSQILSAYRLWESLAGEVQMPTDRKDAGRALTPVEEGDYPKPRPQRTRLAIWPRYSR